MSTNRNNNSINRAHGAASTSTPIPTPTTTTAASVATAEEFNVTKMKEKHHPPHRNIILFKMTDECSAALREAKRMGIRVQFHHTPQQRSYFEIGTTPNVKRFDCSLQQKRDGFTTMDALCRRGDVYQRLGTISSKFQVKATANSYAKTGEMAKRLVEDQRKTQEMPGGGGNRKAVVVAGGGNRLANILKPKHKPVTLPRRPAISIRPSNAIVPGAAAAASVVQVKSTQAKAKASPTLNSKSPMHTATATTSTSTSRSSIQPIQFQPQLSTKSQSKPTPVIQTSPNPNPNSISIIDSIPTRINFKRRIPHGIGVGGSGGSRLPSTPPQSKRPREETVAAVFSSSGSKSAVNSIANSTANSVNESLSEGSSYGSPEKGDTLKIVETAIEEEPSPPLNGTTLHTDNQQSTMKNDDDWFGIYLPIRDWTAYQKYAKNYEATYKAYRSLYDQLTDISDHLKALKKQREEGYNRQLADNIDAMCKKLQSTEYRSMRAEHSKLRAKVSALKQRMIDWERTINE